MSAPANELFVLNPKADTRDLLDGLLDRLGKIQAAALMIGANSEDWSDRIRHHATANIDDLANECDMLVDAIDDNYKAVSDELHRLDEQQQGGAQ